MAKDQKVTLNFKMSDGTTKAVSFPVPAGAGGILPPVAEVIDANTDVQAVAERFFNAMEQKFTEPKVVQYFNVTDAADPTAPPKTAFISIVPTDGGKFILASGAIAGSVRQPQVNYAWYNDDGSESVQIMEMMDTYRRGDGMTVEGDGTNAEGLFKVKLSSKSGNALSIDAENGGLFAEAGGGSLFIQGTALAGDGTVDNPLKVNVSPQPDNQIKDESGLYVAPTEVKHDDSLTGAGTVASPLKAAISEQTKNALSLITEAESATPGLFCEAFVVDLPAGTVLTTVTTPGRYRIKGEANGGASLGFPVPVYSNSEVYMDVVKAQSSSNGGSPVVTQYFYASMLNNRPGPYTRMLISAAWTSWSPLTTEAWVKANMVNWANVSQNGLSLIPVYSTPTFYSYKASDGTAATPEAKTLPSTFDGVVFQLPWAFRKSHIGTFSGVVMAMDANGDLYINIDENYGTNADGETPDAAINWHKFVWVPNDFVPLGILPLDKNSTMEDIRNRVNQLAEVMAAAGLVNINSPV
nr:MAG: hypothetical protein [Bacteriophage sp.]